MSLPAQEARKQATEKQAQLIEDHTKRIKRRINEDAQRGLTHARVNVFDRELAVLLSRRLRKHGYVAKATYNLIGGIDNVFISWRHRNPIERWLDQIRLS